MATFKLVPYTFDIYEEGNKSNIIPFDNFNNSGKNYYDILFDDLESDMKNKEEHVLKGSKKSLSVESITKYPEMLSGLFKYGEFGIQASFTDINTKTVVTGMERKPNHSEKYPYFYLFYIPKGQHKGIAILQNYKNIGVKTTLEKILSTYLNGTHLKVEMRPLISRDLLDQIDKSRLVEFNMIRYNVPKDIAEKFRDDKANEDDDDSKEFHEIRSIVANRNKELNLSGALRQTLSETGNDYFIIDHEEYNEVKAVIEIGSMKKTLTFGNGNNKYRESMELEFTSLNGGFPKYEELYDNAIEYLEHLIEKTGAY
ncbi:hypothetical protein [Methanococcoides sp. FTZ1]|uniref:hypothetical protein n=1 Tax=Methanococcoides sp. FTZ1 TaxID=3439061 RepID=UPI003F837AC3